MELFLAVALCLGVAWSASSGTDVNDVDFLMPDVQPTHPDTYLCYGKKMKETPEYIVGFKPHANMEIAHHILLYGCSSPGSDDDVWICGEMAQSSQSKYKQAGVCGSGSKILYAWAMDAPSLTLPEDVGFKVGGNTGIDYLVLQIHYKDVTTFLPPNNGFDSSGITMEMTDKPQRRRAGVYLLGTGGNIDAHTVTYMETACKYNQDFEIHPFAFRTHAHTLGQVTSGYLIRDGKWTEIGRKSPQKPQMFYNDTTPGLVVKRGDILAARCTMKNDLNHMVSVGSTQNDEMCNFYIMYFTEGDNIMSSTYCFSAGPPFYYWANDEMMENVVANIPKTASLVPGTSTPLVQNAKPGLYEDSGKSQIVDDVIGADMNVDPNLLAPDQLKSLIEYLKERGPRDYEEEYYY